MDLDCKKKKQKHAIKNLLPVKQLQASTKFRFMIGYASGEIYIIRCLITAKIISIFD